MYHFACGGKAGDLLTLDSSILSDTAKVVLGGKGDFFLKVFASCRTFLVLCDHLKSPSMTQHCSAERYLKYGINEVLLELFYLRQG